MAFMDLTNENEKITEKSFYTEKGPGIILKGDNIHKLCLGTKMPNFYFQVCFKAGIEQKPHYIN